MGTRYVRRWTAAERLQHLPGFDVPEPGFYVYFLWDDGGRLAYVGQTNSVLRRIGDHLRHRKEFGRATYRQYASQDEMDTAERTYIHDLDPPLNRRGSPTYEAHRLGGRTPTYSPYQQQTVRELKAEGKLTAAEIGKVVGVSRATVFRMIKNGNQA